MREKLPYLIVVVLYAACVLLVDPRGEFPLNDDWSYTRSAFKLGTEHRMQVDEWSAPNLVGQALYGGLLVRVFSRSFFILRLSTLILSCGTSCLLWAILRRLGTRAGLAWVAVAAWMFNPIQFCLSFSYMTEIPFLFLVTLTFFLYILYLSRRSTWMLLACGTVLGYAFLIRQTALLFAASMGLSLLLDNIPARLSRRVQLAALWAATVGLFVVGYCLWAQQYGGSTPAARRKVELLRHLTTGQLMGNSFGLLFYLSFFLIPLLIYLLPHLCSISRDAGGKTRIGALMAWTLLACIGLRWFQKRHGQGPYLPAKAFHSQMPFLLNVLYDTGLGPTTLDPTYYGPPPTPVYPRIWFAVTITVVVGLVVLGLLLTFALLRQGRSRTDSGPWQFLLFVESSFLGIALFEITFSHLQEGGLFDRHILTVALPLILVLCLAAKEPFARNMKKQCTAPSRDTPASQIKHKKEAGFTTAALLTLAVLAWFCITATHDYLAWNRLRWNLGNELLSQKVDPLSISGGFEFNGWHNYDTFRDRGNIGSVYYWWYDRPGYLITMEPQEGYHILRQKRYFSWLHRRILPLYLLRKN